MLEFPCAESTAPCLRLIRFRGRMILQERGDFVSYMADYEHGLGSLVRMETEGAYRYDWRGDCWERWEYGDAMKWGQGPFMDYDNISDEEAAFLLYKLRVAYFLTKNYGNSYLDGKNFEWVTECKKLVGELYLLGETPENCAIEIGYSCG